MELIFGPMMMMMMMMMTRDPRRSPALIFQGGTELVRGAHAAEMLGASFFLEARKPRREAIWKGRCRGLIRHPRLWERDVGAAQPRRKRSSGRGRHADAAGVIDPRSGVPPVPSVVAAIDEAVLGRKFPPTITKEIPNAPRARQGLPRRRGDKHPPANYRRRCLATDALSQNCYG